MPKFPFIIVEFCGGNERIVASIIDLHVAQTVWRCLEDNADRFTHYVIYNQKQESLVDYEDNQCESSMKNSWTNSEGCVSVNSAKHT